MRFFKFWSHVDRSDKMQIRVCGFQTRHDFRRPDLHAWTKTGDEGSIPICHSTQNAVFQVNLDIIF